MIINEYRNVFDDILDYRRFGSWGSSAMGLHDTTIAQPDGYPG